MEEEYIVVPDNKRTTKLYLNENELINLITERILVLEKNPEQTTLKRKIDTHDPILLALYEINENLSPLTLIRKISETINKNKKTIICEKFLVSEMGFDKKYIETEIKRWEQK